jgi:hypothetical protein
MMVTARPTQKTSCSNRHQDHGQHGAEGEARHDGHREADPEDVLQQRDHAEHGGRGGEDHRPEARDGRLHGRLEAREPALDIEVDLVEQHQRVLDHHAGQAHRAQKRPP